jgi:hypothetical protein
MDAEGGGAMADSLPQTIHTQWRPLSGASKALHVPVLALLVTLGCLALCLRPAFAQDDDWTQVPSESEPPHPGEHAPASPPSHRGATMVCGELARPAGPPYTTIVSQIDQLWGINTPVYESVRVASPHANDEGCIFYNRIFMAIFLRGETDRHGRPDAIPMIYAAMAHEVGHVAHGDFSSAREKVSSVSKELDADRFAGYTLSRLGVPRDNIVPYYSLGGDEFSGIHDHGFSSQRVAAFDKGWQLAEWNRPENGDLGIKGAEPELSSKDDSQGLDTGATAQP